jgi:hypothetical protein
MTLDQAVRWVRPARTSRPLPAVPVLAGSAVAWTVLAALMVEDARAGRGAVVADHMHHHGDAVVNPWSTAWMLVWLLMVAAMMWPLAVPTLSIVRQAAFRGWRTQLVATCLGTITLLWLVAVAVLMSRSARRARVLWRCAKLPAVAPGGVRGLASASSVGAVAWRRCALLCGPLMTAMVVGHDPVLMLCASLAAWWEAAHPRAWRDPIPMLLLAAAGVWLLAGVAYHG